MRAARQPTSSAAVSISRWTWRILVQNLVNLNFFRTIAAGPGAGVKALGSKCASILLWPSVYFERGNKSDIRAFFYKGEVPEGHRHYVATLNVSGDVAIGPTTAERFGLGQCIHVANRPPRLEDSPGRSVLSQCAREAGWQARLLDGQQRTSWYSKMAPLSAFGEPISPPMLFSERPAKTSDFRLIACRSWDSISYASTITIRPGSFRTSSAIGRRWIRRT